MTTTRSEGLRQSDRVTFRMPLEASWLDARGVLQRQLAHTLLVSRNGGVLRVEQPLPVGHEVTLRRPLEGDRIKSARARVVAEIDREPEGLLYAVHIVEPRSDFWDIEFPAPHKGEEAPGTPTGASPFEGRASPGLPCFMAHPRWHPQAKAAAHSLILGRHAMQRTSRSAESPATPRPTNYATPR